jgi:hypothetical protein
MCGIKELYLHPRQTAACMPSWHAQGQMYHVTFVCKLLTIQSSSQPLHYPYNTVTVLLICRHVVQFESTDITKASQLHICICAED